MICASCGRVLPDDAQFCLKCGQPVATATSAQGALNAAPSAASFSAAPRVDTELREALLRCYLRFATSESLSAWLREIGRDPKGSVEEKRVRVREHTAYLGMTPETFPKQTIQYLRDFSSYQLADICEELGLPTDGRKDDSFRRIYREMGFREGWLPRITKPPSGFRKGDVLPFVQWYPILGRLGREQDLYEPFRMEMSDVFGEQNVHEQMPVAYGAALKIDFHIGHPNQGGVGIGFKVPKSNNDVQRALGQVDQYAVHYKDDLILVVMPELLTTADKRNFLDELARKSIQVVVKTRADN